MSSVIGSDPYCRPIQYSSSKGEKGGRLKGMQKGCDAIGRWGVDGGGSCCQRELGVASARLRVARLGFCRLVQWKISACTMGKIAGRREPERGLNARAIRHSSASCWLSQPRPGCCLHLRDSAEATTGDRFEHSWVPKKKIAALRSPFFFSAKHHFSVSYLLPTSSLHRHMTTLTD